jgi:hypothetical protein
MNLPGLRLRAVASRLCSTQTIERVIDPLIADLQMEYAQASLQGARWKARSIRLVACLGLLKVIVLCGGRSLLSPGDEAVDDRRAMIRMVAFSAVSICGAVTLFVVPFWRTVFSGLQPQQARMFLYLIPQAIAMAIPIGLTIGILFGFRGRQPSIQSRRLVLAIAVVLSLMSFANLNWLMPAANQSFRESAAAARGITRGGLPRGANEMTLTELSGEIESYRGVAIGGSQVVRGLKFSYHQRWSLACAVAVLALFAIGVLTRRPSARWTVGLIAIGALFAYYVLLFLGRSAALDGAIPAFVGAWFPNVVFALCSMLLLPDSRSQTSRLPPQGCRTR